MVFCCSCVSRILSDDKADIPTGVLSGDKADDGTKFVINVELLFFLVTDPVDDDEVEVLALK